MGRLVAGAHEVALGQLPRPHVGDRVAAVAPAADVLGDAAEQMGVDAEDAIVMVFDVLSAEQAKAEPVEFLQMVKCSRPSQRLKTC